MSRPFHMNKRDFLKISTGIVILTAVPAISLAVVSDKDLIGWNYNPTTANELFECINAISMPIPVHSNKQNETTAIGKFTHTEFALITGKNVNAEQKLVRAMWCSMTHLIGNKKPIVFWRAPPELTKYNDFGLKEEYVMLRMRLSIGVDDE